MIRMDILVIGCGPAGSCAAMAAKRIDPSLKVAIITRENCGEYSPPALSDYLSGRMDRDMMIVRKIEEYRALGIELILGEEATEILPEEKLVKTASGLEISYSKLILASGSNPIRLRKMEGTSLPGNFVTKTLDDIDEIIKYGGKSAVVVGSGAIGLEGSLALKARGFERVALVEALPWLSPKSLDRECSQRLEKQLESMGIEVYTGEAVLKVEGEDKVKGVLTARRSLPCDLVLWGIGMASDTALGKSAGLEIGSLGGIKTDRYMRTSCRDILACGDCVQSFDILTGQPAMHLFWEPAKSGGEIAGFNAASEEEDYLEYGGSSALFLTHKGGISVAAYGKTEGSCEAGCCTVLEEEGRFGYRRLIIEKGRLKGMQLLGSLEDIELLMDQIKKNSNPAWGGSDSAPDEEITAPCDPNSKLRDLGTVIENPESLTVSQCMNIFRRERRFALK